MLRRGSVSWWNAKAKHTHVMQGQSIVRLSMGKAMHGQSKVRRSIVTVSQCIGLAIWRYAWLGYARAMYGRITYDTAMVKQSFVKLR